MSRFLFELLVISTCWKFSRNSNVGLDPNTWFGEPPGALKTTFAPPVLAIGSTLMSPVTEPLVCPPLTLTLMALTMSPLALTINQGLAPS